MYINAETKLYMLLGFPVNHSLSPLFHNTAFEYLGINAAYLACNVEIDNVKEAVEGIKALSVAGFNVTSPLKEAVIPYLDVLTEDVEILKSANTVVNRDGLLYGSSTDGKGFIKSLEKLPVKLEFDQTALVIGTGGAAKAVALALAKSSFTNLIIAGRKYDKAADIAEICRHYGQAECSAIGYENKELKRVMSDCSLIVYCLPVDSFVLFEALENKNIVKNNTLFYDLRYSPEITPVMAKFKEIGGNAINGSAMLFWQAVEAFELFTGKEVPVNAMQDSFKKIIERGTSGD